MFEAGEHFVGQWLKELKNCDFVEYNLQTRHAQGEIDVVGINTSEKIVYVCEVATHLETGLMYVKGSEIDNVNKIISKFEKDIHYANEFFKEFKKIFMLWTPIVRKSREGSKNNQRKDIIEIKEKIKEQFSTDIEIIYNQQYIDCINQLRSVALKKTEALTSPIMRFLQIEEKLKKFLKKK